MVNLAFTAKFQVWCIIFVVSLLTYTQQQCFYTSNCYTIYDRGMSYRGTVNKTEDRRTCLHWDETKFDVSPSQYPNDGLHRNYCRNPRGSGSKPWCYTGLNSTHPHYWGFCDIKTCDRCLYNGIHMRDGDIFHNGCAQCMCTALGLKCYTCPRPSENPTPNFGCYPKQDLKARYPDCCKRIVCHEKDAEWEFDQYIKYIKSILNK